ncbi:histidine kinase, partial [Aureobasidium melanogenum]
MSSPSHVPKLADVGILELLQNDDRPTFVLGPSATLTKSQYEQEVVFTNIALDTFLSEHAQPGAFDSWSQTLIESPKEHGRTWTFAGRAWTSTLVGSIWRIVYCAQPIATDADPKPQLGNEPQHDGRVSRRKPLSWEAPPAPPSWDVLSPPPLPGLTPKVLDWTKFDVPDLSPHVQFIKNFDWASTPIGPINKWPGHLSAFVISICTNPDPRVIVWGEKLTMIYNAACASLIGEKHPYAMGRSCAEIQAEIWPQMSTLFQPALLEGKAIKSTKELSFQERNGLLEETYWNFIIFPIIGEDGYAMGAIHSLVELSALVINERRATVVEKTKERVSTSATISEIWTQCLASLEAYSEDVPFALIYSNEDDSISSASSSWTNSLKKYQLHGSLGIDKNNSAIPNTFDLTERESVYGLARACRSAVIDKKTVILRRRDNTLPADLATAIPGRGWEDPVETVCVMPIALNGAGALAFFILGLNPRRPFNEDSLQFAHNLRDVLTKSTSLLSQAKFEEIHDNLSAQLKISTLKAARNEDKFTRMAESAPIGICTLVPDGKPIYCNDEYLRLIGVPREYDWQAIWDSQAKWQEHVHADDIPAIAVAWRALLSREKPSVTVEYRVNRPWTSVDKATGSQLTGPTWLMNNAAAEYDENGEVIYIHAWLHETSFRHYTETLLSSRLQEALETKRASENFIDMVSHELRNPLSAILQSADGIITGLDDQEARKKKGTEMLDGVLEAAQTIILCAQHQKCIVDDILCLSKLDSNLLVITPDKVSPPQLIGKVLKMYEAELARASVLGKMEVEQSYHDILNSRHAMLDPSRLLQVVINLLTNAIKFTQFSEKRGLTIYLGASYERPTGARHNLAFIKPRNARHEHSVPLSSEWGQGKDVYLQVAVQDTGRGLSEEEMSLLFQRFSQASPKTYKQYGGSGLGLFISRELCELQGGQIGVSSPGPGQGTTFAFYVRARRCPQEATSTPESPVALQHVWNTPVTGSTAMPQPHDFSGVKNIRPSVPIRTRSSTNTRTPSKPATSDRPLHVLVVEDNLINQRVMAQQLRKQGCVVHIANHGLEALTFLGSSAFSSANPSTPLDVVLMDQEMPVMDGITCVREIRAREAAQEFNGHVPVIAVTANARSEQITVMMQAGMDSVVTKPFRIPELVPQMRKLVESTNPSQSSDGEGDDIEVRPPMSPEPQGSGNATVISERPTVTTKISSTWEKVKGDQASDDIW